MTGLLGGGMTKDELIETLADIEHQRWSDWQRYLHERCRREITLSGRRSLVIKFDDVERWERQIATPYADLSESEKASDREQVQRYWPLIVEFVADWLASKSSYDIAVWIEEMGDGGRDGD